jgi:hypothetical protein
MHSALIRRHTCTLDRSLPTSENAQAAHTGVGGAQTMPLAEAFSGQSWASSSFSTPQKHDEAAKASAAEARPNDPNSAPKGLEKGLSPLCNSNQKQNRPPDLSEVTEERQQVRFPAHKKATVNPAVDPSAEASRERGLQQEAAGESRAPKLPTSDHEWRAAAWRGAAQGSAGDLIVCSCG